MLPSCPQVANFSIAIWNVKNFISASEVCTHTTAIPCYKLSLLNYHQSLLNHSLIHWRQETRERTPPCQLRHFRPKICVNSMCCLSSSLFASWSWSWPGLEYLEDYCFCHGSREQCFNQGSRGWSVWVCSCVLPSCSIQGLSYSQMVLSPYLYSFNFTLQLPLCLNHFLL